MANEAQTPQALQGILLIYCVVPAVIYLLMTLVLCGWKLNEDRMHQIVAELNEREAAKAAEQE